MANNIYIGTQVPSNIYIGTSEVQSIYLGTQKVWEKPSGELLIYDGGDSLLHGTASYYTVEYLYDEDFDEYYFDSCMDTTYCTIANGKIKCTESSDVTPMPVGSQYGKFVISNLDWSNFTQIHLNIGATQLVCSSDNLSDSGYFFPRLEFTFLGSEDVTSGFNHCLVLPDNDDDGKKEYTYDLPVYNKIYCNAIAIIGQIEIYKIWLT